LQSRFREAIEFHLIKSLNKGHSRNYQDLNMVKDIIDSYMREKGIKDENIAIKELIEKGYRYWSLEKTYQNVSEREIWDIRYKLLKVEGRYLYYRLRLKETIDEMKRLVLMLSSVMSELELCYRPMKERDPSAKLDEDKLREEKKSVENYVHRYIASLREDVERAAVDNELDILAEMEDLMRRYRKEFRSTQ